MIWEIVLFVIGYCLIAFLTTILFVYCERRIEETSADEIYKNYSDYALYGFLWVIILPIFLIALIYFGAKALTLFIVEILIAKRTVKDCERGNVCEYGYGYGRAKDCLLTPLKDRWIPVSERLPDTDDEVLCWYEYYHWSREKVLPEYGLGRYLRETSEWLGEVSNGKDVRVIAWMPLPTPFEPQESEDKE